VRPLPREPEEDPVDHIIAWHDGDSRAAIETLSGMSPSLPFSGR
jgi:hypothetical protein